MYTPYVADFKDSISYRTEKSYNIFHQYADWLVGNDVTET